jgi:hypothetical protein
MNHALIKKHARQGSAYLNLVLVEASDILYADEKKDMEKVVEILDRLARR